MTTLREALGGLPDEVFVDLLESEESYRLVVDLPGVTGETVDVRPEDGRLRVEARREKAAPEGFTYVSEDRSPFVDVAIPLPPDAVADEASGVVDRGVLTVTVPRSGETATEIPVGS